MARDKLDIFFELTKNGRAGFSNPFEGMLNAISNNSDAFLFLYDSMPNDCKPDFKQCSTYFKDMFLNVISKQDEKTFNNYFFSGLHEVLDTEELRQIHFKFPENEKLKEYVRSKDNPKNIDEIVHFLSQLWSQNSDNYPEMFQKYLPKLYSLAEIKSKKSRAADYFASWGRVIIKKEGVDKFLEFCETIKLEPLSFCFKTNKNFSLDPENMNLKDLESLINYGDKLFGDLHKQGTRYTYYVIERMSGYAPIIRFLNNITKKETPENMERFTLIWKTQQQHIKEEFNKTRYNTINLEKTNIIDVIKQVTYEIFEGKKSDWYSELSMYKHDFERIIAWGQVAELSLALPINNESANKKLKI